MQLILLLACSTPGNNPSPAPQETAPKVTVQSEPTPPTDWRDKYAKVVKPIGPETRDQLWYAASDMAGLTDDEGAINPIPASPEALADALNKLGECYCRHRLEDVGRPEFDTPPDDPDEYAVWQRHDTWLQITVAHCHKAVLEDGAWWWVEQKQNVNVYPGQRETHEEHYGMCQAYLDAHPPHVTSNTDR